MVKNLPAMQETQVHSLGWKDSPGEGNGNPFQYSAWEVPGTEEPSGLFFFFFLKWALCMGLQRVGCDWATNLSLWFTELILLHIITIMQKKKKRHGRKDWKKYKANGDTDYVSMVRFRIIFFYQNFFISIYLLKCIKKWNLLNNS